MAKLATSSGLLIQVCKVSSLSLPQSMALSVL